MAIRSELGCQTTLYFALDEELANESGNFYSNCTKFTNSSFAVSNYLATKVLDDETAEKLWNFSCEWSNWKTSTKLISQNSHSIVVYIINMLLTEPLKTRILI